LEQSQGTTAILGSLAVEWCGARYEDCRWMFFAERSAHLVVYSVYLCAA